jgi:large subunit ribosomal protein L10
MSKVIKQMEMDALRGTFRGVRDLVVLSVSKLSCQGDYAFRAALRKKNIRLQVVKNSLTRKVFRDLDLHVADDSPCWQGPTMLAWGGGSVSELARAIEAELKHPKNGPLYRDKITTKKGAIADGQPVTFEQALKMPTRVEAIGRVVTLALSPASRLLSQIRGPGGTVACQIKSLKDRENKEGAAPAPAAS